MIFERTMTNEKTRKRIENYNKFQPLLLLFAFAVFFLSFVLGVGLQKIFYNVTIVEVQAGVEKYKGIPVSTEFESGLKEIILRLSRGYEQSTFLVSVLVGGLIGVICFVSAIYLFFIWFIIREFLKILNSEALLSAQKFEDKK